MTDFADDLRAMAQDVARLERRIADIQSVAPQRVEATDHSGAVTVVLGPDGLPESVNVADDWLRLVGSEGLGGAVTQACRTGAERRAELWSEAAQRVPEPAEDAALPVDPSWGRPTSVLPPRMIMEDALALMGEPATAASTSATGSTALGRLTLTLSPDGTVSCTADPHWVSQLTADELTDALNRILAAARTELAGSRADTSAYIERLDDLHARLWGLLRSLR